MRRIRKATLIVLLCLLVAWSGTAWAAETGTGVVTGNLVNIRSIPSTSGQIVTQVAKGTQVSVLGLQDGWYKVQTQNGKQGWIADYLLDVKWVSTSTKETASTEPVKIKLDNRLVELDTPPYIDSQNRTMVPIRFVATELGSQVFWNPDEHLVTITGDNRIILLWIGHAVAKVNGVDVELDTTPVVKDGRTMVPLRFVGDSLGVQVGWDAASRTVVLTSPQPATVATPGVTDSQSRVAMVTASVVNVRSGPGTDHAVVTQVKQGDALSILGQANDWYQIQTKDGNQGWVANWLVAVRTDSSTSSRSAEPGERATPSTPVYTGPNWLTGITVHDLGDELDVVLTGQHPLNYSLINLSNPQRIVLDFYNTTLSLGWDSEEQLLEENPWATALRVGQFTEDQARVVVDLKTVVSYSASPSEDGTQLTLKLKSPSIKGKVIVIDPGHGSIQPGGWSDPGAVGKSGLYERDVNTSIAWKLAGILESEGATVIMTRTGDTTTLDLKGRANIANNNNADIFVSIHCNSSTNPSIAGTSTYYYAPANSVLGAQRSSRQRLASLVQQELVSKIGRRDIGILEANFAVLRETLVPSILVETAFISNAEEERLLASDEFRTKVAEGIAQGIIRYFAEQ